MNESKETWRPIPWAMGNYEISSHGRVKSIARRAKVRGNVTRLVRERILKPALNAKTGYYACSLCVNNKIVTRSIHGLVAEAWLSIGKSPDRPEVNHKDGDKTNNHWSNLEYVSSRENTSHAIKNGLQSLHPPQGSLGQGKKLNYSLAEEIRIKRQAGAKVQELQNLYSVSRTTISSVINNRTYTK